MLPINFGFNKQASKKVSTTSALKVIVCLISAYLLLWSRQSCATIDELNLRFKAMAGQHLEKIGVLRRIAQDHHGFMWFAGNNGLARFDAYDVKYYKHDDENSTSISHNNVTHLLVDSQGTLWASTSHGLNRYDPETDSFIHYFSNEADPNSLSSNSIAVLSEIKPGTIGIGTYGGGFNLLNVSSGKFTRFQPEIGNTNSLSDTHIVELLTDHSGTIWLGTLSHGIDLFNPETRQFTHSINNHQLSSKQLAWPEIQALHQDKHRNIWVATSNLGVYRVDAKTQTIQTYTNIPLDKNSLADDIVWDIFEDSHGSLWFASDGALNLYRADSDDFISYTTLPGTSLGGKVRAIFEDKEKNLWLGLFPSGVALLDRDAMKFRNYQHLPDNTNSLSDNSITSIAEDSNGNLWLGTENGLNYFDRNQDTFTQYFHDPLDPNTIPSNAILSVLIDSEKRVWVGTWRGGWAYFTPETGTFNRSQSLPSEQQLSEEVWSIYEDKQNTLWVAGLYKYDRKKDQFQSYQSIYSNAGELSSSRVKDMLEDSYGEFWLATKGGLNKLNRENGHILKYDHNRLKPNSISSNYINCLLEDSLGNIWIGTRGGGLNKYNRRTQSFQSYGPKEGLPDDSVIAIIEDQNQNLWMTTGHGISQYNPKTKTFTNLSTDHGLPGNVFNRKALLTNTNGEIIAGGTQGLTIFKSETLEVNTNPPPIVFTKLQIFNTDVLNYGTGSPLQRPIHEAKSMTLNHSQSVFSIEYSALNYRLSSHNQYAYKLEGFDSQWNNIGNLRRATYTNINPGTYTFHVKGSNNSGIWNKQIASLEINILPPWWKTWWAYFIYCTVLFAAIYFIIFLRVKLKVASNDRQVSERLQQLDKIKDTFLANTSHELRTPLNGIIGLTQSLIDTTTTPPLSKTVIQSLEVIVSSGKRLSHLINDILDFSKLRNHTIELSLRPLDIYPLVSSVVFLSKQLLLGKPIHITCYISTKSPLVYADEQRLQQILYNLVGNAIKFTDSGEITISSKIQGNYILISIKDTGIGIKHDELERIFVSFEQSATLKGYSGTGLGLSVTKQLILLHGGSIDVESCVGVGSTFTFSLPIASKEQLKQCMNESSISRNIPIHHYSLNENPSIDLHPTTSEVSGAYCDIPLKPFRIMIVDDEPVNRLVIEKYLTNAGYEFIECRNGDEALRMLESGVTIDLILLDVMMPGKSGYEVCEIIRLQHPLHILPILFLTANSQAEDLQKGYEVEGNDFLFKPVLKEELLAKINVHLKLLSTFRTLSNH